MNENHITIPEDRVDKLRQLALQLGYPNLSPELLHLALCHSSYANEDEYCENYGNERLEFLGDAIVGYAVTEYLYNKYTHLREGQLSKIKSIVVSKRILSQRTTELGLGQFLLLGKGEEQTGGRTRFSILGNLFESIVGAIHLSCGIEASTQFVLHQLKDEIEKAVRGESIIDFKSKLQELIQRDYGVLPSYKMVSSEGPDHDKEFVIEVYIRDKQIGRGKGKSKKRAEKAAASDALTNLNFNLDYEIA